MINDQEQSRCRPGKINGDMNITGDVCLDGGNYQDMAFRSPPICQNRRFRVIGENNSSENGVILYNRADCEDHMGRVSLCEPLP